MVICYSDGIVVNLLLVDFGGFGGGIVVFIGYFCSLGDIVSWLDVEELELNCDLFGDEWDIIILYVIVLVL